MIRLFKSLGWTHGRQFLCVALHSGGQVLVKGTRRTLEHNNVNELYTQNQELRFLIIDEVGMIPDELLGEFQENISSSSMNTRYSKTHDNIRRPFGGYNLCVFGDLYHIPPIPSTAALFIPPPDRIIQKSTDASKWMIQGKKSEFAHAGLDFIWGNNIDLSINYFQ